PAPARPPLPPPWCGTGRRQPATATPPTASATISARRNNDIRVALAISRGQREAARHRSDSRRAPGLSYFAAVLALGPSMGALALLLSLLLTVPAALAGLLVVAPAPAQSAA